MIVQFATNRLKESFEKSERATRTWGSVVGGKYIQRVNILQSVQNFTDLHKIRFLRLHKLSGQRDNQYSIILDRRWRLIVAYSEIDDAILVVWVTNHYGD